MTDYFQPDVAGRIALDVIPAGCSIEIETAPGCLRARAIDKNGLARGWSGWMGVPVDGPVSLWWGALVGSEA